MTSLRGKGVFITGGARGIGAEAARRLRNRGAKLVLTDLEGADLPSFAELLTKLPWPSNKTTTVEDCAAAFVTGIEGRRDRISCPRWVGLFRWLKPVLSNPVGELPIRKATAELLPRIDAEAAALGPSMSASNVDLVRETPS